MNKKFLSAILFGALAVASTGSFVSCKDYDDDIESLQSQITNLSSVKGDISSVQSALEGKIAAANSAAEAAQKAADAAKAAADAAGSLDAAKAYADAAVAAAKAEMLEQAQKTLDEVVAGAISEDQVKAAIAEALATIETVSPDEVDATVAEAVKAIKNELNIDGKLEAMSNEIAALKNQDEVLKAYAKTADVDAAIAKAIEGVQGKISEATKAATDAAAAATAAGTAIDKAAADAVKAAKDAIAAEVDGINTNLSVLGSQLRALVFEPELYYWGVEAVEADRVEYLPVTVNEYAVSADKDNSNNAQIALTGAKVYSTVPELVMNYHLNPTTADLNGVKWSYVALDRKNITTRSSRYISTPVVTNAEKIAGGKVQVTSTYNGIAPTLSGNNDTISVIALQATMGDTVVTSDYAAILDAVYKDFVVAHKAGAAQHMNLDCANKKDTIHLYNSAAEAIAADPQAYIVYDDKTGINLLDYVATHAKAPVADATKNHIVLSDALFNKFNFAYEFALVGYVSGNNKTSESAHALITDGKILRAQLTSDGKQPTEYSEANINRASIDRMPLVRVILRDTKSNNIVSVGYIKFKITEKAQTPAASANTVKLAQAFDATTPISLTCAGTEVSGQLNWWQVEEQIIAKLGLKKDEFEADYKLDVLADGKSAVQYTAATADATAVTTQFGKVEQTTTDDEGHQTEVIKWTIKQQEAYTYFVAKASKDIIIRYSKKNGTSNGKDTYDLVYVTIKWAPSNAILPAYAGSLQNSAKISNTWYAENSAVPGSGYSDIHGNVEVMNGNKIDGVTATDCAFEFDILNTFVGNTINTTGFGVPALYSGLTTNYKFEFDAISDWKTSKAVGQDGTVYNLLVEDGVKLYAYTKTDKSDKTLVASLSGANNNMVTYADNDVAKNLLNKADHDALGYTANEKTNETFSAKIKVVAKSCLDYVGNLNLSNSSFYVKFLRPVSPLNNEPTIVTDAGLAGTQIVPVVLDFEDWRDFKFQAYPAQGITANRWYEYYEVTGIKADLDNITTDLNGNDITSKKLTDVTKKVVIGWIDPVLNNGYLTATDKGKITYDNNGTTLGTFHLRIPVTVTYKWGELKSYVNVTVQQTQSN